MTTVKLLQLQYILLHESVWRTLDTLFHGCNCFDVSSPWNSILSPKLFHFPATCVFFSKLQDVAKKNRLCTRQEVLASNPLIEIRLTKIFIIMATFDNPYGHLLHANARKTSRVSGAVSRFKMYQEQRSIKYVCKCKQETFSGVASMRVSTPHLPHPPPHSLHI